MASFYSQPGGVDPQSAFADALARARQIAAKISNPTPEAAAEAAALKRPFEDSQPEAKKVATSGDSITAQLRSIADQQSRSSQAIQAAAAAAAQINQKIGSGSTAPAQPPLGGLGPHAGLGAVMNEQFSVPDRMVGLIIGKGGEQIATIQAESGCKIQFAPDSGGMPDRPCTLTGSPEAVGQAKDMISKIIHRGQAGPDPNGMMNYDPSGPNTTIEMMVPGNKVGLVIGKGGETIRQLQERAGVKMVMIQDSNVPTHQEKPLRITGEPMKCQKARDMLMELIAEKDGMDNMGGFGNEYGGMGGTKNNIEIRVPRTAVGVVIGKGGDMIKKIQTETGARVQFMPDDGQSPERICNITGPSDKMQEASNMIQDLIASAMSRGPGMGRGRGRGRGGDRFGPDGGRGGGPGRGGRGFGGGDFSDETQYTVPADKCGLVIGKGGDTIREINRQSGAYVELQRAPGPNPGEKVFTIRGNPGQIEHAIQLICEKAGLDTAGNGFTPPPSGGPGGMGGPGGPGGPGGGPGGPGFDQFGGNNQFGGQFGGPGQQNQQPQPPQYNMPQGWGNGTTGGSNAQYNQWQNQPNQSEPNKPQDPNAAAWAAYYQYYNQGGQGGNNPYQQQPGAPQQQQQQQQPPTPQQQQQAPTSQPAAQQSSYNTQANPSINPQTGQLDYSAAWAEYYRQQGMHYHAQAILAQAAQQGGGGGQPGQPQPQPQMGGPMQAPQ